MTKSELIGAVHNVHYKYHRRQIECIVLTALEEIGKRLARGDKVIINGFGTFEAKERKARKGINPRTGEEINLPASKYPHFRGCKALKAAINR